MRRIRIALLAQAAVASAAFRIYDVDAHRNSSDWSSGAAGVSQSFICTSDSLLWAELFVGEANSPGAYRFDVIGDSQLLCSGWDSSGPIVSYQFIRAGLSLLPGAPGLDRGGEYILRITHSSGEPIHFYYAPNSSYRYGHLSAPGSTIADTWDLVAKIEGANRPANEKFFGVNAGALDPLGKGDTLRRILALMDSAGIMSAREFLPWWSVQPSSANDWQWSYWDRVFRICYERNIEFLPCLSHCPGWATSGVPGADTNNYAPKGLFVPVTIGDSINPANYWGNFVYRIVARYSPGGEFWRQQGVERYGITDWEIWNEPNYWRPPKMGYDSLYEHYRDSVELVEALYARACDVALQAALTADSGARVFVGSLGGTFYTLGVTTAGADWLAGYYLHRNNQSNAGITAHPYQYAGNWPGLQPDTFWRDTDTLRALMKRNGDRDKELIATELAWSHIAGKTACLDFNRPALSIPEAHILSLAGDPVNFYDRIFWFPLWNFDVPSERSWSCELLHVSSDGSIAKRPSYYAYQQMTRELLGRRMNGRILSGNMAVDAKARVYELEDSATGRRTWLGWRNYEPGAKGVAVKIPARTDRLGISPLARSTDADRLNRRVAAGSDGWLWLSLDTIPVYVHEVGSPKRPDLTVDSVWTEPVGENQVTLHAKVRNTGNRQFAPASHRKGCVLRFTAEDQTILPASEPRSIPPGGFALIRSLPFTPEPGVSYLVSARANPDRDVMELGFDNNTGYCPLSVR
jgi:hypothetical protein